MTRQEYVQNLTDAATAAIANDAGFLAAMAAFKEIGERVTGVDIRLGVDTVQLPSAQTAEKDAAFLRSLRIAPDLTLKEQE
jgi:hypothetical protein